MKTRNHQTCGIATKTLTQQTRQLTVTVWHIHIFYVDTLVLFSCFFSERCNNFSQSEETLVDFNWLFLSDAFCFGQTLSLRSRQVNDLQLRNDCVVWIFDEDLLNSDAENGVRSRRSHVHFVAAKRFVLQAIVKQMKDLVDAFTLNVEQVLHGVNIVLVPLEF